MKDTCTIIEEHNKAFRTGHHNNLHLDPEKRTNRKRQRDRQEKKYRRLMEDDDLR